MAQFEGNDIYVIQKVEFFCIPNNKYDRLVTDAFLDASMTNEQMAQLPIHPCSQLIKLLSSGSFYFSHTFDLTRDLKSRRSETQHNILDSNNSDFVWNKSIMAELQRIKRTELGTEEEIDVNNGGILVPIIQGFVSFQMVNFSGSKFKIGIISRYFLL
jgi:hypothetical protein